MRFEYNGRIYVLEFERAYKQVSLFTDGQRHTIRSTYPYTTAILRVREKGQVFANLVASGTVGCMPLDKFSNAAGRLFAMKNLNGRLLRLEKQNPLYGKEFRSAMWKAYNNRAKQQAIEGTVVSPQLALPPAPEGSGSEGTTQPTVH